VKRTKLSKEFTDPILVHQNYKVFMRIDINKDVSGEHDPKFFAVIFKDAAENENFLQIGDLFNEELIFFYCTVSIATNEISLGFLHREWFMDNFKNEGM
jgi:hypothetical protein